MSENINLAAVTLEDCIDMYEKRGKATLVSAGNVIGFFEEQECAYDER